MMGAGLSGHPGYPVSTIGPPWPRPIRNPPSCREAKVEKMVIDTTEYRFKMALAQQYVGPCPQFC